MSNSSLHCLFISYAPRLLKPVLYQLADSPVDLVSFILGQAEDVKDNVVQCLRVSKRVRFLLMNGMIGVDAEFGFNLKHSFVQ